MGLVGLGDDCRAVDDMDGSMLAWVRRGLLRSMSVRAMKITYRY